MFRSIIFKSVLAVLALTLAAVLATGGTDGAFAADTHTSGPFAGAKVNGGTVTHSKDGETDILTLSEDFVVPETPDPHWQVVDSNGNAYLLQRLPIKGDKINTTITVPSYVPDIAKVQIWCAFAETLLGEASFDQPIN